MADEKQKRAEVRSAPESQLDVAKKLRRKKEERERAEEAGEIPDLTEGEVMSRTERKARVAELLRRGLMNDRLVVADADPSRHYVWVREREEDLIRFRELGYELEYEAGEGEHETPDDRRRVGDLVLMSTSMENRELIQEVKRELREKRLKIGEKEYLERARNSPVPVIQGS